MFSSVVYRWRLENGANHILRAVKLSQEVVRNGEQRKAVQRSLQNNPYFAHPTNVLLAMLGKSYIPLLLLHFVTFQSS